MGVHGIQENMLRAVVAARDRFLKPNGVMIPRTVRLWVAPLCRNPLPPKEFDMWRSPVEGIPFREIFELSTNDTHIAYVRTDCLAHPGKVVHEIDTLFDGAESYPEMAAEFVFDRDEQIYGIAGWFDASLYNDVSLDTSPASDPTHWQQAVYPAYPPVLVRAGDALRLSLIAEPANLAVHFSWQLSTTDVVREFSTRNNYLYPA
jgi:hypothetical protein